MKHVDDDDRVIGLHINPAYLQFGEDKSLDLAHVDVNGSSTIGTDLATLNTVTAHINALDGAVDASLISTAITPSGQIDVLTAVEQVDGILTTGTKVTLSTVAHTGNASDVSFGTTAMNATNVQTAIEELLGNIKGSETTINSLNGNFTIGSGMLDVDDDDRVIGLHINPAYPVSAAGPYIDFVINVKSGDPETPEHIYVLLTSLVDVYTAGDGITISTTNVVSAKLSQTQGNQISFDANGGLFVPAGETITDVSTIDSDCLGTAAETPVYYGYVNSQYVVITKTGSDPDTYEYNGQPYTGAVGGPVPCGHRYLVVQTSGGNMYFANNDTSADIHVSNFSIATNSNDEDVLRITMNDTTTYDVLVSDINPVIPDATVDWDTQNDTLSVGTDGLFTQLAIGTIEAYIDNFDCGTFTIGTV